jgi:hypothetical protein
MLSELDTPYLLAVALRVFGGYQLREPEVVHGQPPKESCQGDLNDLLGRAPGSDLLWPVLNRNAHCGLRNSRSGHLF